MNRFLTYYRGSLLFLFCFFGGLSQAQQTQIIFRNTIHQTVEIKWYSQQLFYPEGVNLYRKQVGQTEWIKLNSSVIQKGKGYSEEEISQNEDLEFWLDVVKQGDPNQLPPLLYVQMLSKSFLEPQFADFLGVRFVDKTAQKGQKYQYRIKKLLKGRELTVVTSEAFAVGPYQAEKAPQGLKAEQKKDEIKLSWEVDELRFFAYHVYRASAVDKGWVKVNRDPVIISLEENETGQEVYPEVKYKDDSLATDIAYSYYIQGVNYFGDTSLKSDPFILTFGDSIPPQAPVNLKVGSIDAKKLSIPLSWFNQYSDDMVGLQIYRGKHSEGPFTAIQEKVMKKETEEFTDVVPEPGGYYYYVAALDGSGNQGKSHLVFAEVQDVTPPAAPQNVRIEADTGLLTLLWDANTEDDLAGYRIVRTIKGAEDSYVVLNPELITETVYQDELFKNAKNTFLYKVLAVDTLLNVSEPSKFAGASMPDAIAPEAPFMKEVREKEGYLVISWTPSADIDIEGYDLYRSVDDTNYFKKHNLNTIEAHLFRYTDRRLEYGHQYFYKLVAIDASGNESIPSAILSGELDQAKQKVAGARNIQLKRLKKYKQLRMVWEAPKVKAAVKGYIILRKQNDDQFKPISGMIKAETAFLDQVNAEKDYSYQIRTYYATGQYVYSEELVSEGKKGKR